MRYVLDINYVLVCMSKYLCVLDCYSNNYKLNADIPIWCHTVLQIKFNAKYTVVTQ